MGLNELLEVLDSCVGAVLSGLQGCKQDPKGNIRVRQASWKPGTEYTDLPIIEILGKENGVRGFYMVPALEGAPAVAVLHLLCAKLYMAGFVAADKQYQNQNSDGESLLMVLPASKETDPDPAAPGTLRTYALTWFDQAHKALKGMGGKNSGCMYLIQYTKAQNKSQQVRLIAVSCGSIVYECDIKDSMYYTGLEVADSIKAMVLDSDNIRIQKVANDSRLFSVPVKSITKVYLIDWLR